MLQHKKQINYHFILIELYVFFLLCFSSVFPLRHSHMSQVLFKTIFDLSFLIWYLTRIPAGPHSRQKSFPGFKMTVKSTMLPYQAELREIPMRKTPEFPSMNSSHSGVRCSLNEPRESGLFKLTFFAFQLGLETYGADVIGPQLPSAPSIANGQGLHGPSDLESHWFPILTLCNGISSL